MRLQQNTIMVDNPITNIESIISIESACVGHPDKLCDQISDGIVDACIKVDPNCKAIYQLYFT